MPMRNYGPDAGMRKGAIDREISDLLVDLSEKIAPLIEERFEWSQDIRSLSLSAATTDAQERNAQITETVAEYLRNALSEAYGNRTERLLTGVWEYPAN
jgi:hypothetical protein